MLQGARNGLTRTREGMPDEHVPAAVVRAGALRAYRVHVARLAAGHEDDEESIDAEAGAILDAETGVEIHELHAIAEMWREANSK